MTMIPAEADTRIVAVGIAAAIVVVGITIVEVGTVVETAAVGIAAEIAVAGTVAAEIMVVEIAVVGKKRFQCL